MSLVSNKALELIKKYEGFRPEAYLCPANKWTIGYGTTEINGKPVVAGMKITRSEAERLLKQDAQKFCDGVLKLVRVPLTENQLAALTSFAYNVGLNHFKLSTMLKLINQRDFTGAAKQLDRWVYGGGRKLPGLIKRRAEERKLFEAQ